MKKKDGLYRVGDRVFKTKYEIAKVIRSILDSYELGCSILGIDLTFVLALLALHPKAIEKIGRGILCIVREDVDGNKQFCIKRVDGTKVDFNYVCCLYPGATTQKRLDIRQQTNKKRLLTANERK